jgi:hypothetical protein
MNKEKFQLIELCKGKSCCPVILFDPISKKAVLKEGDFEIELTEEHIEGLKRFIEENYNFENLYDPEG